MLSQSKKSEQLSAIKEAKTKNQIKKEKRYLRKQRQYIKKVEMDIEEKMME